MLIDWLTFRIPEEHIDTSEYLKLRALQDRIMRISTKTGEVEWETGAWDSIRSDSHQVTIRVGSDALWIQGSPARVFGNGCNVFSSGHCSAMNLIGCVQKMVSFVQDKTGTALPTHFPQYIMTKIDITGNLALKCLPDVRVALSVLKNLEGGRYRVSQQAGDTIYINHKSKIKSAKMYAKGPHCSHMNKTKKTNYSYEDIQLANRLLRLELSLKSEYLQRQSKLKWWELEPGHLYEIWEQYFEEKIGGEAMNENEMIEQVRKLAKTNARATAAISMLHNIRSMGRESAKNLYSRSMFYMHQKLLKDAGFTDMEISTGNVIQFNKRVLDYQIVDSWDDLKKVANAN